MIDQDLITFLRSAVTSAEQRVHSSLLPQETSYPAVAVTRTSIEKIRRQDLVRAAYRTFLEHGLGGMTVARIGERAELWENVTAGGGSWLTLKLHGTRSNRDGIGAEVRIGSQVNHMTTSVGYASSSHAGVHFGLGSARVAERVEIRWPSGVRQVLTNVAANRAADVTEPAK